VTITGKLPGEVMPEPEPGTLPPEITLDDVQLETPAAKIASSATSKNVLRRRQANGAATNPQASGHAGQAGGGEKRAVVVVSPVAISTTTLPTVLAGMPSLVGLKLHAEFGGNPLH